MDEVPRSLLREIIVMRHYLYDITATLHDLPARAADADPVVPGCRASM